MIKIFEKSPSTLPQVNILQQHISSSSSSTATSTNQVINSTEKEQIQEINKEIENVEGNSNKAVALHCRKLQLMITLKQNTSSSDSVIIEEIYKQAQIVQNLGQNVNKLALIPYAEYLYSDQRFTELEELLTDLGYLNLPESVEPFVNYFVLVLKMRELDKDGDSEAGELKELCEAIIEFLEETARKAPH